MKTIRTEREVKMTKLVNVYVADDGTEFNSERECIEYERNYLRKPLIESLEKLEIKNLRGMYPPTLDSYNLEEMDFIYYNVEKAEDIDIINSCYKFKDDCEVADIGIYCIEDNRYWDEAIAINMESVLREVKSFLDVYYDEIKKLERG